MSKRKPARIRNPAPLRSRLLNDIVVRKAWRDNESCQSGTGQSWHREHQFIRFWHSRRWPKSANTSAGKGRPAVPSRYLTAAVISNHLGIFPSLVSCQF
jgi:hypothetical protein